MLTADQIFTLGAYYIGMFTWICLALIFLRRYLKAKKQYADQIFVLTLLVMLIAVSAELFASVYYGFYWSDLWWWETGYLSVLKDPFLWGIPRATLAIGALSILFLALRYGERAKSPLHTAFRHVGLPLDVFRGLREGLERMYQPGATSLMLYRAGKEAGKLFAKRVAEKGCAGRELFDKVAELSTGSGWMNKIEVLSFKPRKEVIIRLHGSFESIDRKEPKPVCDFQRGFWAGLCQSISPKMVCEGKETHCEAKGDSGCEFKISFFKKAKPMKPKPT